MEEQIEIEERSGYVPIYRKIIDEIFFQDSHYVHIWLYILLNVNHKKRYYKFKEILPGQFLCGRKNISESTGINESKVQRILKYFEEKGYIEQQTNNHGRVITVLSWGKYNNYEQPVNNQRTTSEQPVNTTNNVYNDNNEEKRNTPPNPPRGTRDKFIIPELSDIESYVNEKGYLFDPETFYAHYESKGWLVGNARMKSWKAACVTWDKSYRIKNNRIEYKNSLI